MKTITIFNNLARTAMTLVVMMIAVNVQTAKADDWPEYISDVMLIGGSESTTNSLKTQYQNQGWTVVDYDLNKMTPMVVYEAALQEDETALDIFRRAGYYLGVAASNMIMALEPDRVVITGGVAAAGDLLLDPIRETVKERVHVTPLDGIEIVPGELGDDAGVIGNSLWVEKCLADKTVA